MWKTLSSCASKMLMNSAALGLVAFLLSLHAGAQGLVPVVDAEAGPCSVELIALDADAHPVAGAQISVDFRYGFLGFEELNLQVSTNADGLARFEGLPEEIDGVLFFQASADGLKGVAVHNLDDQCRARHSVHLVEQKSN